VTEKTKTKITLLNTTQQTQTTTKTTLALFSCLLQESSENQRSLFYFILPHSNTTVHQCLIRYRAPRYLASTCMPVSEVSGRQHLRSASRRKLNILRFRHSTFGTLAFSVAGPKVWSALPDSLRDPAVESERSSPCFSSPLNTSPRRDGQAEWALLTYSPHGTHKKVTTQLPCTD